MKYPSLSLNDDKKRESIEFAKKAFAFYPACTNYRMQLIMAYFENGNYENALDEFHRYSFYNLDSSEKCWIEVYCHLLLKNFDKALEVAEYYLKFEKESNLVLIKALVLSYKDEHDYTQALELVNSITEDTNINCGFTKYVLHRKMKQFDQARNELEIFNIEHTHSGDGQPVFFLRCALIIAQGAVPEAKELLYSTPHVEPNPYFIYYRAVLAKMEGSFEEETHLICINFCKEALHDDDLKNWLLYHDKFDRLGLLLNAVFAERYEMAAVILLFFNENRRELPFLMDEVQPALSELLSLFPSKEGLQSFYDTFRQSLFFSGSFEGRWQPQYKVTLPRETYPFPRYVSEKMINGLEEEYYFSKFLLSKYQGSKRAALFFRLKEVPAKKDRIYGRYNFLREERDDYEYQYVSDLHTTLQKNLVNFYINNDKIAVFLFIEEELLELFQQQLFNHGCSAACILLD